MQVVCVPSLHGIPLVLLVAERQSIVSPSHSEMGVCFGAKHIIACITDSRHMDYSSTYLIRSYRLK